MIRFASIACAALLALSCTKTLNHQICKDIEFAEYHLCIEEGKSGFLLCPMRMSRKPFIWKPAKVLIDIMQGIPILVFLMIMFYIIFASSHTSARVVAIIAFAINFGAYVSEVFRSGIMSIDKGQTEAGLAMGFGKVQTFSLFVAPQALKKMIPVFKRDPYRESRKGYLRQEPTETERHPRSPVLLVETQIQQAGSPGRIPSCSRKRSAISYCCIHLCPSPFWKY